MSALKCCLKCLSHWTAFIISRGDWGGCGLRDSDGEQDVETDEIAVQAAHQELS